MIIGISGKINSGKSMVSSVIKQLGREYNKKVTVKSFAQPIYRIVSDMTGLPIPEIKERKKSHSSIYIGDVNTTFRSILQVIGNGLREYGHSDIWLDSMFGADNNQAMTQLTNIDDWWIIDDLRYVNEAERIKSLGGYLLQVRRDKSESNSHQAENSLNSWNQWDMVIDNNYSTKDEARDRIHPLLDNFVREILYG